MAETHRNDDESHQPHLWKTGGLGPEAPIPPLVFSVSAFRLIGMGFLCIPFVAAGAMIMMGAGNALWKMAAGLLCIIFFGGGYLAVLWTKLRAPVVLTLSEDGLRPQSGGFIPWEDFEAVGTGQIPGGPGGSKIIGIRLKSLERYAASFTPAQVRLMRGTARVGKAAGTRLPAAPGSGMRSGQAALRSLPQQDPAEIVLWNRAVTGWDVSFSPMVFKGRAQDVVRQIESYHQAVLKIRPRP